MIAKLLKCSCFITLILSCAGCHKKPIHLKPLTHESAHDSQTKEQVTVHAKRLSFEDQENMFDDKAIELTKHHIVPVQITVENKSEKTWFLANKNISLKLLTVDEVNKILFATKRLLPLAMFITGLTDALFATYMILLLDIVGCGCKAALFTYGSAIAGAFLVLSTCIAIACGIANHLSKKQMHEYLKTCCNMEGLTIAPDINASMLFFVEESQLPKKLNLLLVDKNIEQNTLPFELNL
jgi:hypothetical protein